MDKINDIKIIASILFEYYKKVDDNKILWSMDEDFSNPDYTFTINSNKVIITDKKGNLHTTFYRENDSLFIEASGKKSAKYDFTIFQKQF